MPLTLLAWSLLANGVTVYFSWASCFTAMTRVHQPAPHSTDLLQRFAQGLSSTSTSSQPRGVTISCLPTFTQPEPCPALLGLLATTHVLVMRVQ